MTTNRMSPTVQSIAFSADPSNGDAELIAPPVRDQPETLEDVWQAALAADHRLRSVNSDALAADALIRRAQSERLPAISVDGSYTLRDNEPSFVFDVAGLGLPSDTFPYAQHEGFEFGVHASIPIYTSGRLSHQIDAATARGYAAALHADATELDTKMEVAISYLAVLRAQRGVEVAETTVKSLAAQMTDVSRRLEHHIATTNDALATEVALTQAKQSLVQSVHALDSARAALNRRLGRPLTTPVSINELAFPPMDVNLKDMTSQAMARRPEPARLAAQAEAMRQQSCAVRSASRPQAELHGGYSFQENRFQDPEGIASAGVRVSWNLLDSGRTRHEVDSIEYRVESIEQLLAEQRSQIALEVRTVWLSIQETQQRTTTTRRAVDQAVENLRVVKARNVAGTGTNSEVLRAEALRTRALNDYYSAIYDSAEAVLALRRAVATL